MSRGLPFLAEVERKFCGLAVPHLTANAGVPGFCSLRFLGEKSFKDTYYDCQDKLSKSGLWVRRRQNAGNEPVWEAKCRIGGDLNNSMFEELTELPLIAHRVASITGQHEPAASDFGLKVLAELGTQRKSWLANERFKIVVDTMDCGHGVGEVELEQFMTTPHRESDIESWKRHVVQDMDRQIQDFMREYHWAFKVGTPKGKLTAFFERQR